MLYVDLTLRSKFYFQSVFKKFGPLSENSSSPWCPTRQFLEYKGYFAQIFLNLPQTILCNKRSPYKLSVVAGTLYFPLSSCHRLENRKFGTWNLVLNCFIITL